MEWIFASIDPSRPHELGMMAAWHGRLMVLAWGVIFPLGILSARFLKIAPRQDWPKQLDNQLWWHSHWILQSIGGVCVLIALCLIWGKGSTWIESGTTLSMILHHIFGWLVVAFGVIQILGGLLRGSKGGPTEPAPDGSPRGDHYDMTKRRLIFEYLHKFLGYPALLLSWATLFLGMWIANGPVWMFLVLGLWFVFLIALFEYLQRRVMALDTYQAIWGPDPKLPGNQRKPIGFGIWRRPQ